MGAKSDRYQNLRGDLELVSDALAGPMYGIRERGECDYVFADRLRFPGVSDAEAFLKWCRSCVAHFRKLVLSVRPMTADEQSDQDRFLQIAEKMEELSALAYQIVKARSNEPGG